ncbi:hypothetical protein CJJ09_005370 [Candidozyma auris]|nr:hypothetical protein CJJ09_005370 [[Candida] auris]
MSDHEKLVDMASSARLSGSLSQTYSGSGSDSFSSVVYDDRNFLQRTWDSFKPINLEDDGVDTSKMTEMEKSIYATSRHPLARRLKARHLQMIAIGGSIGTGLFVGSGYALAMGGPSVFFLRFSENLLYVTTAVVIGCLVPYTDERLLNGSSSEDITASPFVIAINNGGINVLPDIMNAVILVAVVSVGSSSVYGCSRSLASLAVQGLLPKCIGYIDRNGRPLVAILITNAFGLLGFLASSENQGEVFTWFFSVCSLAAFFTWIAICFTHLRFRWALNAQGRTTDEVIFVSPLGIWGSLLGMIILILIVIGEIWVSIWPIGSPADAEQFFKNCLSMPVIIVLCLGFKAYKGTLNQWLIPLAEIDLDTGRREIDVEELKQEIAEDRARLASKSFLYRLYRFWC